MAQPIDPTPAQLIAEGIIRISESMNDLLTAGLKRKTIITLVHASTGLPQRDIAAVMTSLEDLCADWCEPES